MCNLVADDAAPLAALDPLQFMELHFMVWSTSVIQKGFDMKRGMCAGVLLMGLCIASAHAAGRLTVELRPAQERINQTSALGDGRINLVLRNEGDKMIEVSKDGIPMTNSRGRLTASNFIVTGDDGTEVPYAGIVVDYDESELRTVRIPPKGGVVTPINIVKNYQVEAGQSYVVSLRQPIRYVDRPRELMANASKDDLLALMKTAEATSIRIFIDEFPFAGGR